MVEQVERVMMAADLTAAWLGNAHTRASVDEVAAFLTSMHRTVSDFERRHDAVSETTTKESFQPAVSARKSLASPEHIVSMIDGKRYKSLKRHLSSNGLTPDEYRQRFNLKADYPMVAPAYSEARRAVAKTLGLGRKAGAKVEKAAEGAVKKVRKTGQAALTAAREALGSGDQSASTGSDEG